MKIKGFARIFDDNRKHQFHYSIFVYDDPDQAALAAERCNGKKDREGYLGLFPIEVEVPDAIG